MKPTIAQKDWWDKLTPDEQDEYMKEMLKPGQIEVVHEPKRLAFKDEYGYEVRLWEKDIVAMRSIGFVNDTYGTYGTTDKDIPCYLVFIAGHTFKTFSPLFAPYFEEPRS